MGPFFLLVKLLRKAAAMAVTEGPSGRKGAFNGQTDKRGTEGQHIYGS